MSFDIVSCRIIQGSPCGGYRLCPLVAESRAPGLDFGPRLARAEHEGEAQLSDAVPGLQGWIRGICGLIEQAAIEVCVQNDHGFRIVMGKVGVDPVEAVSSMRKGTIQ